MSCSKFRIFKLTFTYFVKMSLIGAKEDPIKSRSK